MYVKYILIISSFLLLLVSCRNRDENKIEWYSAMSCPSNYIIEGPTIYYFNKGELISSASTTTDIYGSWGFGDEARNNGKMRMLPDSVSVNYGGLNNKLQMCNYEGGSILPYEKIKNLFKNGFIDYKEKKDFREITTGMAPGGKICVWIDFVEIKRFKIKEIKKYSDSLLISASKKEYVNAYNETLNYLTHHPINYSTWEHPDARYDLDFGFCTLSNNVKFHNCYFNSKEGILLTHFRVGTEFTTWGIPYGQPITVLDYNSYSQYSEKIIVRDKKMNLPVDGVFEWIVDSTKFYSTCVVMPKDLPQRFTKTYINPKTGKKCNYNRIIFGVEKDGIHCIVWLDGPGKQEKIIRFKGLPERNDGDETVNPGGYATEVVYY